MMSKQISDDKLLEMLLIHGSPARAAANLEISTSTIYKRLQDDALRERYNRLQGTLLSVVANSMSDSLTDAVACLRDVLSDPEASINARIQAADSLLRHCCRYVETANIIRRIERLEDLGAQEYEI